MINRTFLHLLAGFVGLIVLSLLITFLAGYFEGGGNVQPTTNVAGDQSVTR